MPRKDYYKTLGVARSASPDEIRAAYRKLARTYHPDVNKSPDAQRKFTEIQEAYDILSDPEKRSAYDRFGRVSAGGRGEPHYAWTNVGGDAGATPFDLDDLGGMFDAFFGGRDPFGGAGARPQNPRRQNPPLRRDLQVTFLTAARGGTETVTLETGGAQKTVSVSIPKATADGTKLRVKSAVGNRDLILTVRVGKHPIFARAGKLDLQLSLPVTVAEATLGATLPVPTLRGPVNLSIPPGTPSGRKLRLRGRGLEAPDGRRGDLYAIIRIVPPDPSKLTDVQRQLLRDVSEVSPSPRSGHDWPDARTGSRGIGTEG